MLFRTVYGPELGAVYLFVKNSDTAPSREIIHRAFVPELEGSSTQNVDDALSFLGASGLINQGEDGSYVVDASSENLPFRLLILLRLRDIAEGIFKGQSKSDPLYWMIINELFILPDSLFVENVHTEANRLREVTDIGGLSREKLQSWKRVMAYLGVGTSVAGGFQCAYSPQLILDILRCWEQGTGALQEFLETHFLKFLPFRTKTDDLAAVVQHSLLYLETAGQIKLAARQDSPSKPYFGSRRVRYIGVI